jgi:hypothetical protein
MTRLPAGTWVENAALPDPTPSVGGRDLSALRSRPLTPAEITVARRTVAAHARDAADCRVLLDALGLLNYPNGDARV